MAKQKKHKKKMPEDDKNNVAFYKKKNLDQSPECPDEMSSSSQSQTLTSTPNPAPNQKEISNQDKTKSWSQIASTGLVTQSSSIVMNKTTRIKPKFKSKSNGYDRIVITPTHFNNKPYSGFIKDEEAEIISKAVGLHNLDNHMVPHSIGVKKVFFSLPTN